MILTNAAHTSPLSLISISKLNSLGPMTWRRRITSICLTSFFFPGRSHVYARNDNPRMHQSREWKKKKNYITIHLIIIIIRKRLAIVKRKKYNYIDWLRMSTCLSFTPILLFENVRINSRRNISTESIHHTKYLKWLKFNNAVAMHAQCIHIVVCIAAVEWCDGVIHACNNMSLICDIRASTKNLSN